MLTVNLALQLIILIVLGIVIQRLHIVNDTFDQSLSSLLLKVALPCMIISSMQVEFSPADLLNCGLLLLLSLLMMAVSGVLGAVVHRLHGKTGSGRILRFSTMFCNFSFVGMPVMEALYGQQGLFYFVIFTVPVRMVYYSAAKPLLSPPNLQLERPTLGQKLLGWFSPPVIGVLIGLALYLTQLPLPEVAEHLLSSIGAICSPLGMILCGLTLGKYNIRRLLKVRYLLSPLLRNFVMPAVVLGLMLLFRVDPFLARVVVLFHALPVASLMAAFTIQYDPTPSTQLESAGSVFLSTLISAGSIPVWAQITDALIPI